MKILLASTRYRPLFGGIENSIFFMAREMKAQGHEVKILTSDLAPDNIKDVISSYDMTHSTVQIKRYSKPKLPGFLQILSFFFQFINIWRAFKAQEWDIIIARDIESALPLFIKYKASKKAYIAPGCAYNQNLNRITQLHDQRKVNKLAFLYNKYWFLPFMRLMQTCALKRADFVSAWSNNTLREIRKNKFYANKWASIRPGVDCEKFHPSADKNKKSEPLKLLMLCRLDPLKNIDHAIMTIQKLNFDVHLNIVGSGGHENDLKELTRTLGLEEKVHFLGQTTQPEVHYRAADYFLMLSSYEPFGQTIIEAMACGLPVISYAASSKVNNAVNEIISDNEDGYIINYGIDELTKKLTELNSQTIEHRNQVSRAAAKKIQALYSWENTVKSIEKNLGIS